MLTPDYFYGKSDKLIEMYQDLEDSLNSEGRRKMEQSFSKETIKNAVVECLRNLFRKTVETATDGLA